MRFRLLPDTLFLAVNIIDRFLSARVVSLAKLQLVGITCMFVAAKVRAWTLTLPSRPASSSRPTFPTIVISNYRHCLNIRTDASCV